jgi:two-component system chemotaxis sensor kinase CheA
VIKQYSSILKRVRNISGSTILGTGEVCMVLNPYDLIKSAKKKEAPTAEEKPVEEAETRKSILVAEDSITVRTQMKRILEGAGYEVTAAVDGLDAYNKLRGRPFDALVSDIMMPNMDGLALTERIRQNKKYREMPVILVTSLASDEDRQRGLDAGANAYITKPSFDQKVLLDTLRRLI